MLLRAYRSDDLETIHRINEAAVPAVGTETIEDLGLIADESTIAVFERDHVVSDTTWSGYLMVGKTNRPKVPGPVWAPMLGPIR
jgi:hypothetical protein